MRRVKQDSPVTSESLKRLERRFNRPEMELMTVQHSQMIKYAGAIKLFRKGEPHTKRMTESCRSK